MKVIGHRLFILLAILFPMMSGGQSLTFRAEKVVRESIELYDYDGPVRIRTLDGFGGVYVMGRPFVPALLCADSVRKGWLLDCYEARTGKEIFFDDPHVEFVDLFGSHQAVIFEANVNYSGSGATLLWTLLVLNHDGLWKNLLQEVTTSNQSDHLFWHLDSLSKYGFLSLADYIWGKGEDHYGPHRYQIRTYKFCANSSKYALADEFITSRKFVPVDAPQPYVVIRPMLPEIQRRLQRKTNGACR